MNTYTLIKRLPGKVAGITVGSGKINAAKAFCEADHGPDTAASNATPRQNDDPGLGELRTRIVHAAIVKPGQVRRHLLEYVPDSIRERAYQLSASRSHQAGHELGDWLEAESEIENQFYLWLRTVVK